MSIRVDLLESTADRPTRGTLGRVGLTVMGVITAVTTLISVVTVWLMLTRPLDVVGALGEGQATEMARALAGLMVSVLRDLIKYL